MGVCIWGKKGQRLNSPMCWSRRSRTGWRTRREPWWICKDDRIRVINAHQTPTVRLLPPWDTETRKGVVLKDPGSWRSHLMTTDVYFFFLRILLMLLQYWLWRARDNRRQVGGEGIIERREAGSRKWEKERLVHIKWDNPCTVLSQSLAYSKCSINVGHCIHCYRDL